MEERVPRTDQLTGVSVVLPVVTETTALDETARVLYEGANESITQVIIVICDRTTRESRRHCEAVADTFGSRTQIHRQEMPYLGGALRESFSLATASHTLMMASDLETDPALAAPMIALGRQHPGAVITASRWADGGSFGDYGTARIAANWLFQRATCALYRARLTDATFGYRLFPTALLHAVNWTGEQHEFLLETVLKPVRLGVPVVEIPTSWKRRRDGVSQNSIRTQSRYIAALWRDRFTPVSLLLSDTSTEPPRS
jgi:hypothetical protein